MSEQLPPRCDCGTSSQCIVHPPIQYRRLACPSHFGEETECCKQLAARDKEIEDIKAKKEVYETALESEIFTADANYFRRKKAEKELAELQQSYENLKKKSEGLVEALENISLRGDWGGQLAKEALSTWKDSEEKDKGGKE